MKWHACVRLLSAVAVTRPRRSPKLRLQSRNVKFGKSSLGETAPSNGVGAVLTVGCLAAAPLVRQGLLRARATTHCRKSTPSPPRASRLCGPRDSGGESSPAWIGNPPWEPRARSCDRERETRADRTGQTDRQVFSQSLLNCKRIYILFDTVAAASVSSMHTSSQVLHNWLLLLARS